MKNNVTLRVLLADDHRMVREGIRLLLSFEDGLQIAGEASDGLEAEQLAETLRPDIAILDLVLPRLDGALLTQRLKTRFPEMRVIIVTGSLDRDRIVQVLACGADACVLKESGSEELLFALDGVMRGERYFSDAVLKAFQWQTTPDISSGDAGSVNGITQRELEILAHIASGHDNQSIAEALKISFYTVRKHRENLMRKLDLHNAAELTAYALRYGLSEASKSYRLNPDH